MKNTTLCYIEKYGCYLMLHRTKKKNDQNKDKWIAVGGKFENGESPEECALREVKEETGLILKSCDYKGIVTFVSDKYETEYMHIFYSNDFEGNIHECDEGELEWVKKEKVYSLYSWEGDKIFLSLIEKSQKFFSLKLVYLGEILEKAILNGKNLKLPFEGDF